MTDTTLMSFDRVADVYDATRGMPPAVSEAVSAGLARLMRATAPAPRVLEVGVGTGRIAAPLAAQGIDVTGIDISRGMLDVLRGKSRDVTVLLAEATRQPFTDSAFDAALFVHILHLVPDPEATLDASIRAVRPGGLLIAGATRHDPAKGPNPGRRIRDIAEEIVGRPLRVERGRNYRAAEGFEQSMAARAIPVSRHVLAGWSTFETGRALLDEFEQRTHSWTWDIPAAAVPDVIQRARPEIEQMCGGLDEPVERINTFIALVGQLP